MKRAPPFEGRGRGRVEVLQVRLEASLDRGSLPSKAEAEPDVIRRILEHLDLPSVAQTPAPPRAPPQLELGFEGG